VGCGLAIHGEHAPQGAHITQRLTQRPLGGVPFLSRSFCGVPPLNRLLCGVPFLDRSFGGAPFMNRGLGGVIVNDAG